MRPQLIEGPLKTQYAKNVWLPKTIHNADHQKLQRKLLITMQVLGIITSQILMTNYKSSFEEYYYAHS
jgi:hypothetical protein